LARANLHWTRAGGAVGLAIFQGADAYVSPSWYPSKKQHGRVVPTWNYEAAHIHGRLTWRHEADWLLAQVSALSDHHEASRAAPWAVSDAPEDYIRKLTGAIVGVELTIERVEVTRKLSQNRTPADRSGVAAGLAAGERPSDAAVAALMTDADPA
jgi:transcriptional regulator